MPRPVSSTAMECPLQISPSTMVLWTWSFRLLPCGSLDGRTNLKDLPLLAPVPAEKVFTLVQRTNGLASDGSGALRGSLNESQSAKWTACFTPVQAQCCWLLRTSLCFTCEICGVDSSI